jgi:hypothetical protein
MTNTSFTDIVNSKSAMQSDIYNFGRINIKNETYYIAADEETAMLDFIHDATKSGESDNYPPLWRDKVKVERVYGGKLYYAAGCVMAQAITRNGSTKKQASKIYADGLYHGDVSRIYKVMVKDD